MNKEQAFIESCKDWGIYPKRVLEQYRKGQNRIIYTAQTPFGYDYGGYKRGTIRAYEWKRGKGWEELFSNTKAYRGKVFLRLYSEGKLKGVSAAVIENYLTNGYTTRRGLLAHYTDAQINKMKVAGLSHALYFGSETGDSKTDHENRVELRRALKWNTL